MRTLTLSFTLALLVACAPPYTFHGTLIETPLTAPDFILRDQHNQTFQLSRQTGHVVLVFFGYTDCPDACPAALSQFQRIHERLGKQADQVRFVMITVDPERDTPERLGEFVGGFDPDFLGLTGPSADLFPVWRAYGVDPNPRLNTLDLDHETRFYAIDPAGNLRLTFSSASPVAETVEDLQHLLP